MKMKRYSQEDFILFEVDEFGCKICPSGDYTLIKDFGERCDFAAHCIFGTQCSFGAHCRFSGQCSFGEGCSFGAWCSFGEDCSFGEKCSFENGAVKNGRYVAVDRIGSANRKAYFFMDEDGKMFVRAGCWFSDMATFRERVKEVHAGTIHKKTYLAACDFAELMLEGGQV